MIQNWQRNDRGIAILFTLGILSLLLVLAMSFATDAIIERKSAYNNNARVQARILAQSALNRAIAGLKLYSSQSGSVDFNRYYSGWGPGIKNDTSGATFANSAFYSSDADSDSQMHEDIYRLFKMTGDHAEESFSDLDKTYWQFVREDDSSDASRIIGRYAFAVCTDSGRLDVAAAVDSNNGGSTVSSYYTGTDGNGYYTNPIYAPKPETAECTVASPDKLRIGADVSELSVRGAMAKKITTGLDAYLTTLSSTYNSGGYLADGQRWFSHEQMFAFLGLKSSDTTQAGIRAHLQNIFNVNNSPDPEAYWADVNNNGIVTSSGFFHRFNLAQPQATWDAMTVDRLLCVSTAEKPQQYYSSGAVTTDNNASGIQFLRKIADSPGTFPSYEARRRQIAANLLNYCSAMSREVVSDVTPSTWDADHRPTYTGNKRTFYINEVGVKTSATIVVTDAAAPSTLRTCKVAITSEPGGEIINMYSNLQGAYATSGNYSLTVSGYIAYTAECVGFGTLASSSASGAVDIENPTAGTNKEWLPFSATITGLGTANYHFDWKTAGSGWTSTTLTWTMTQSDTPNLTIGVRVVLDHATLTVTSTSENVDFVDFRKIAAAGPPAIYTFFGNSSMQALNGTGGTAIASGSSTSTAYISAQVDDPRQNLNYADWALAESLTGYPGTAGTVNSFQLAPNNSTSTLDKELAADPAYQGAEPDKHISTAYIAHAAMHSPWELGCINRGGKWETLNLKAYKAPDNTTAYNYQWTSSDLTNSGYSYANGDAGILDQVKMVSANQTYGKIDLNTLANPDVYCALVKDVLISPCYNYSDSYLNLKKKNSFVADENDNLWPDCGNTTFFKYFYDITGSTDPWTASPAFPVAFNKPYKYRSAIAPAFATVANKIVEVNRGATKPATDAETESLIGKTINFTTAGLPQTEVRLLIVAQTIRDVGGSSTTPIPIYKNINGTNEQVKCFIGKFDRFLDANKSAYYYDEITGEQKLYVILARDMVTNKFIVKRMEYLQE